MTAIKLYVEVSELEKRELRALAVHAGVPFQRYLGWVLREHLNAKGLPIEGSVKL